MKKANDKEASNIIIQIMNSILVEEHKAKGQATQREDICKAKQELVSRICK